MKASADCAIRRSTSCTTRERDLSEQLFALRLQKVTGQLEKPARVRQVRKDLARVLTILHERQSK